MRGASIPMEDGTSRPVRKTKAPTLYYHVFQIIPKKGPRPEIIIDSTYLQFFDPVWAKTQKLTFIGTETELVDFFAKNREHLRIVTVDEPDEPTLPPVVLRDPEHWVRSMYGLQGGVSFREVHNVPD